MFKILSIIGVLPLVGYADFSCNINETSYVGQIKLSNSPSFLVLHCREKTLILREHETWKDFTLKNVEKHFSTFYFNNTKYTYYYMLHKETIKEDEDEEEEEKDEVKEKDEKETKFTKYKYYPRKDDKNYDKNYEEDSFNDTTEEDFLENKKDQSIEVFIIHDPLNSVEEDQEEEDKEDKKKLSPNSRILGNELGRNLQAHHVVHYNLGKYVYK